MKEIDDLSLLIMSSTSSNSSTIITYSLSENQVYHPESTPPPGYVKVVHRSRTEMVPVDQPIAYTPSACSPPSKP